MPRAIWSGSLSFGLVNVPVKVVSATRQKDVRFNLLHEKDGGRIDMKRFCTIEEKEVPYEEIAKGWKVGPDEYVMVHDEDFATIAAEKTDQIEILDFVDSSEIDPIYYEKPYYLVPEKGAGKAYGLLVEAMRRQGRVAIAKVVMRQKERLVAVRVIEDVLAMTTLLFHDEVIATRDLEEEKATAKAKTAPVEREIEMAEKLIESLTTEFKPDKYRDEYRERVLEMLEAKAEGKTYSSPAPSPVKRPKDLVEALQASLEAARRKHHSEA